MITPSLEDLEARREALLAELRVVDQQLALLGVRGPELTPRQEEVLRAIVDYVRKEGMSPTFKELGALVGLRSSNGVEDAIKILERKGYVERTRGSARSIRIKRWPADTGRSS